MQDHQKRKQERGHPEIQTGDHTRNDHGIKEPEVRKTYKLGQVTLLDMQGRETIIKIRS